MNCTCIGPPARTCLKHGDLFEFSNIDFVWISEVSTCFKCLVKLPKTEIITGNCTASFIRLCNQCALTEIG